MPISLDSEDLRQFIRNIPNFPKPGIIFRDITPLLLNPTAVETVVEVLYEKYYQKNIEKVVCIESRGFILGSVLAYRLGAGFVPVRKPGKLPAEILRESYELEYGTDAVEMHRDAIDLGQRVLIHDDLLATGGTAYATCKLVQKAGGTVVGFSFLIELAFLNGRERLKGFDVQTLITYDSE